MTESQQVKLITEPTVFVLAEMEVDPDSLWSLVEWVRDYRPECIGSDDGDGTPDDALRLLMPHGGYRNVGDRAEAEANSLDDFLTSNEMLVEIAGRKCYNSFGLKSGRKSNKEYIEHTQVGDIPHASIMYHAKMSFFIGGVSRRVSHELIRNYVGADREEEGSPSQESTRYTHHPGHFVVHPRDLESAEGTHHFRVACEDAYRHYLAYIEDQVAVYKLAHDGKDPMGLDRKRIYECAAGRLPGQAATSWIWTTNPVALAKLFRERCNEAADLEFQRLAKMWKKLCLDRWPNLFPQPWMQQ